MPDPVTMAILAGIYNRGPRRFRWRLDRYAGAGGDARAKGGCANHHLSTACQGSFSYGTELEGNILACVEIVGAGFNTNLGSCELLIRRHASARIY